MRNIIIGLLAGIGALIAVIKLTEYAQTRDDETSTGPVKKTGGQRERNLEQLIEHFRGTPHVRNRDVVELLGVSPKTARNYFTELEERKVIRQQGKTGRDVYYVMEGKK